MNLQAGLMNSYRVEASGWDASENFFVENVLLTWGSNEMEEIRLRCSLKEGSIIFVRLLRQLTSDNINTIPIPYQVMRVMPKDVHGLARVQLRQLRPQSDSDRKEAASKDVTIKIACPSARRTIAGIRRDEVAGTAADKFLFETRVPIWNSCPPQKKNPKTRVNWGAPEMNSPLTIKLNISQSLGCGVTNAVQLVARMVRSGAPRCDLARALPKQ